MGKERYFFAHAHTHTSARAALMKECEHWKLNGVRAGHFNRRCECICQPNDRNDRQQLRSGPPLHARMHSHTHTRSAHRRACECRFRATCERARALLGIKCLFTIAFQRNNYTQPRNAHIQSPHFGVFRRAHSPARPTQPALADNHEPNNLWHGSHTHTQTMLIKPYEAMK